MENFKSENEKSILDDIQKQLALAKILKNVYENRPDLRTFVGAMAGTKYENDYTEEKIKINELYVEKRRREIDEENSSMGQKELNRLEGGFQLSEILQAMITDRLNKNWFKEIEAIMTSDFDDLVTGIDAVMKHKKGGYLGLSFDFTVTNHPDIIDDKLKREWNKNNEKGIIPVVKYFEDPETKQKGRLLVPKFIVGASKKDVEELANAYLVGDEEFLDNHPFKYVMLLQIEEQLQTVLDYYEVNDNNDKFDFARLQYERIQKLLRNLKNEIHMDEKVRKNVDLYEYTKGNVALKRMRRFRMMRDSKGDITEEKSE
jgi:hypothetical protein